MDATSDAGIASTEWKSAFIDVISTGSTNLVTAWVSVFVFT
jgi:hypothetical protein